MAGEDGDLDAGGEYIVHYKAFRESVAKKKPKAKAKGAGKGKGAYKKEFPIDGDAKWSLQAEMRQFMPCDDDDAKLYNDPTNLRWQVYWSLFDKTRSYGYNKHGSVRKACLVALKEAWAVHTRLGGNPPTFVWPLA